jgi:hypothetical protein
MRYETARPGQHVSTASTVDLLSLSAGWEAHERAHQPSARRVHVGAEPLL